jgi:hypothetical protein
MVSFNDGYFKNSVLIFIRLRVPSFRTISASYPSLLLCRLQLSLGFQPEFDAVAARLPSGFPLLICGEPNRLLANALAVVGRVGSNRNQGPF